MTLRTGVNVIQKECKTQCCAALRAYRELGGKPKFTPTKANADNNATICCSSDQGIECNGNSVTSIDWSDKKLKGELESADWQEEDQTRKDLLFDLKSLKKLDLSNNSISGFYPLYLAGLPIETL